MIVIPAKTGIHRSAIEPAETWIPAFAGMTGYNYGRVVAQIERDTTSFMISDVPP